MNGGKLWKQCRHIVSAVEGFAVVLHVLPGSSRKEQRVGVGCLEERARVGALEDEYNLLWRRIKTGGMV